MSDLGSSGSSEVLSLVEASMNRACDEAFMWRALTLACAALGRTFPNPAVGCVITQGDVIVAEAATAAGGRPHAEERALAKAGALAAGATVYVTLEPCGERSSGAMSCSHRLAEAKVSRIVVAASNPDVRSAGRGTTHLQASGIKVEVGLCRTRADRLYRGFHHWLATGLPLLEISASGQSFDGEFVLLPGEKLSDALTRYGRCGYTRLWVPENSPLKSKLEQHGLLS